MNRFTFYLQFYSKELWAKKWTFLLITWLISVFGIIVVMLIPNQYKTRAGIHIDTDQLLSQVLNNTTFSIQASTEAQAQKVQQMIYSTANLRRVLRDINTESYSFSANKEITLIEDMRKNLTFTNSSKDYYEISYLHEDKEIAYKTLKKILDIFIESNIRQLSTQSNRAVSVSEDTVKIKQREFAQIQKELSDFKSENSDIIDRSGLLLGDIKDLENIISNYPSDKRLLETRIRNTYSLLAQTKRSFAGKTTVNPECNLQSIINDINSAKARGLTESHPDIIYLEELLSTRKASCGDAITQSGEINPAYTQISSQLQSERSELAELEADYKKAQTELPKLKAMLSKQPAILEKLETLEKRKAKAATNLGLADQNNDLLQGTIDVNRKTGLVNYEVIEEVLMPIKPEKPNRLLLFIGTFLASLVASAGFIIMRVQMEQRMATIYHLREAFDLPILGNISMVQLVTNRKTEMYNNVIWLSGLMVLILLYISLIYYYIFLYSQPDFSLIADKLYNIMRLFN